jgi:hypothetical protein
MGIEGETWSQSQGALEFGVRQGICNRGWVYARVTEEKASRQDNEYRGSDINGSVTSILQPAAPAKGSITREILVVLAQLVFDDSLGDLFAREAGRRFGRRELLVALVRAHLRSPAVATGQQEARAERARRLAGRGKLSSVAPVDVCEIKMLRPGALERGYAFAATAHRFGSCRRGIRSGAIRHVSVGNVCAARRRRLVQLVMQAQRWAAAHCLC